MAKYVRLSQVTYPSGRVVVYGYGTSGAMDDIMSRVAIIGDGTTTYASYKYLGVGTIVTEDYEDIQVKLDYAATNFAGLDRFGRVVDQVWMDYGADPDVVLDHYTYEYDRAGNRTSRANALDSALDEEYVYDALNRLTEWKVNGSSQKTWTLDALGNNLSAGTYNAANEETPTQGSSGYDAAGNMTTLKSGDTAVYDAWNRVVEVNDGQDITEQYEYDGTNRRIQIYSDFSGSTPDDVQNDFHSGQQIIETRSGDAATAPESLDPTHQNIWSPRYIDSLIVRDTYSSGVLQTADRLYYLADANYNVTGVVKYNSGASQWQVAERYSYTPYGEVTYRDSSWTTTGSSVNDNTTLYTGRTLDLATGLYYYRARYYDAVLERFISTDPIGYKGGMNLYEYVGDSPANRTDPSGLLFGWGYGNYCGWSRRGPGVPIDALDKACQEHDNCQATWWTCNPFHILYCSSQLCWAAHEAEKTGCAASYPGNPAATQQCKKAAKAVQALFCALGLVNPGQLEGDPLVIVISTV